MHRIDGAGTYAATDEASYVEQLRVPDLSFGTYCLPAGADDPQAPHSEDEVYIVVSGRARLWTPDRVEEATPGTVLFVPAGEPHRFIDVVEDLTVMVVFGPAEYTRQQEAM